MDDPNHHQRVVALADAVRNRPPNALIRIQKQKFHTPYKKFTSSSSTEYTNLSIDHMNTILKLQIDPIHHQHTVTVEGSVTMHQLCNYLLPLGYLPALTCEGEYFTIAGLINGFGIQSSSHRYGLFHDTVTELEIILANGDIIIANNTNQYEDIFFTIPGSFSTIGIIVSATIKLIPATQTVCSRITRYNTLQEYSDGMRNILRGRDPWTKMSTHEVSPLFNSESNNNATTYIEGYVFSSSCYVIIETEFIPESILYSKSLQRILDSDNININTYPIYNPSVQKGCLYYYQYIRESSLVLSSASSTPSVYRFTQSTLNYLFRHTRGLWWGLENYIGIPWLTNTYTGRSWLDDIMKPKLKSDGTPESNPNENGWQEKAGNSFTYADYNRCLITQGFYIEEKKLSLMIQNIQEQLNMYPIWICPIKVIAVNHDNHVSSMDTNSSIVRTQAKGRLWKNITGTDPYFAFDVGVYGVPQTSSYKCYSTIRKLQSIANSPTQWGLTYVTQEELCNKKTSILDIPLYLRIREKYYADQAYPSLWKKIKLYQPKIDIDEGVIPYWRLKRDGLLTSNSLYYCSSILIGIVTIIGWFLIR